MKIKINQDQDLMKTRGDSIYNVGFCDSHCKEYFAKDYTIFNGRKLNGDVRQELEKKDKIIRSLIKNKTK